MLSVFKFTCALHSSWSTHYGGGDSVEYQMIDALLSDLCNEIRALAIANSVSPLPLTGWMRCRIVETLLEYPSGVSRAVVITEVESQWYDMY